MVAVEGKIVLMALAAMLAQPALAELQAKPAGATPAMSAASPARAGAPSRARRHGSVTKAPAAPLDPAARRGSEQSLPAKVPSPEAAATPAPASAGTPPEPVGSVAEWFPADAYPPQARAKSQEGLTVYAVELDPRGRIMRCNVVQSSGSDLLDSTTCTLVISNGRFRPARDAAGKSVAGRYQGSMRWKLVEGPASEE